MERAKATRLALASSDDIFAIGDSLNNVLAVGVTPYMNTKPPPLFVASMRNSGHEAVRTGMASQLDRL
jgi:hypothetical protein